MVLIGFLLVTVPVVVYWNLNFLLTTILFFGVPSLYLLIRRPKSIKKALISALLFGTLWGVSFDFLAEINNAWSWPEYGQLVLPGYVLGVVSIDVLIWFFLWVLFTVLFYEYFFEHDRVTKISPNTRIAFWFGAGVIVVITGTYYVYPDILLFDYAYGILGLLTLPPFIFLIAKKPHLIPKTLKVIPFFALLYLVFELTALHLDQWRFPGQYIGEVGVLGVRFPLEEFFFWILISSAVTVGYHELFVDDER